MTVTKTVQYSKVESISFTVEERDINEAIIIFLKQKFPEDKIEWFHQTWKFEYGDTDDGKVYCEAVRNVWEEVVEK